MKSNRSCAKTLVVIQGATATGKTQVGIHLARAFGSEVISSDSRQVYREMNIGTAKPTAEERAAVPHHMIGIRSVTQEYSAGQYEQEALVLLDTLFARHDLLFLVGGSGLYIDAVCQGMDHLPSVDCSLRQQLNEQLRREGLPALLEQLQIRDPNYYEQMDRQNPQRVVRALEVCLQTGQPYSLLRTGREASRPFRILKLGIRMSREQLYPRINQRVDEMIAQGLEQEVAALYPLREFNALQTVGYRELFDYLDGKSTRDQAIDLIKRNSRRYAKRQETWFNRNEHTIWFDGGASCADSMENYLMEFVHHGVR